MGLVFFLDKSLVQISWSAGDSLNSFVLLAMPLFIFMGPVCGERGSPGPFWRVGQMDWIFARRTGFGGHCSQCGLWGHIGFQRRRRSDLQPDRLPGDERRGYNPKLSIGSIAVGGTLSVLVPPSLILIVYGSWENQLVARLFAAAMIPGLILSLLLLITVIIWVKLNPAMAPRPARVSWKERLLAVRELLPWLAVVTVMGSIFGGLMTPTEAAALGAVLSLVIAWGYKNEL